MAYSKIVAGGAGTQHGEHANPAEAKLPVA
jgi:hypothetical protein